MENLLRDAQERIILFLDYDDIMQYAKSSEEAAEVVYSRNFWKKKIEHDTKVTSKKAYLKNAILRGHDKVVREFIEGGIIPIDEINGIVSFDTAVSFCPFTEGIDGHFNVLRLLVDNKLVNTRVPPKYSELHPKVAVYLVRKGLLLVEPSDNTVSRNLPWFLEYAIQGGDFQSFKDLMVRQIIRTDNLELAKRLGEIGNVTIEVIRVSQAMNRELSRHPNIKVTHFNNAKFPKKKADVVIKEPIAINRPEHIAIWNSIQRKSVQGLWHVLNKYSPSKFKVYYETSRGNKGIFFISEHSLRSVADFISNPSMKLSRGYDYVSDFLVDSIVSIEVYEYVPK